MVSIIYSHMHLKFNSLSIDSFLTKSSSSQFGRAMKSENQAFVSEEQTLEHLNDVHHRLGVASRYTWLQNSLFLFNSETKRLLRLRQFWETLTESKTVLDTFPANDSTKLIFQTPAHPL